MGRKRKDGRSTITVSPITTAILHGDEDLSAWTDEELVRGQRRSPKTGHWIGRKPTVVPRAVHDELVRRRLSKGYDLLRDNLLEACSTLTEVMKDKRADPHARIKAAQLVLQYVAGKPPDRVLLGMAEDIKPKWMQALTAGIVSIEEGVEVSNPTTTAKVDGDGSQAPPPRGPVDRSNERGSRVENHRRRLSP
jgi:hypothetical protein